LEERDEVVRLGVALALLRRRAVRLEGARRVARRLADPAEELLVLRLARVELGRAEGRLEGEVHLARAEAEARDLEPGRGALVVVFHGLAVGCERGGDVALARVEVAQGRQRVALRGAVVDRAVDQRL